MMLQTEKSELLMLLALAAAAWLLTVAALELMRQSERVETAATRADLAAWQVSEVLQHARRITQEAAEGMIEPLDG
jgi:hypothetical protein